MSKIAVLGGGLSGRLIAFQLAEQGVAVELFEKGERNGAQAAAYVAAAMLAPSAEAVEATPEVIRLGKQSIALWRAIVGRLNTPVMMQENGSLIVLAHAGQAAFRRMFAVIEARRCGGI